MADIPYKYPVDWRGLEDFDEYSFDSDGLPRVDYGGNIGLKYNPITISQFGLHHFSFREELDYKHSTHLAMHCADWLVENARSWKNGTLAWIMDFQLPLYGPKPPWISGMAQGEAVSLLLRAYQETRNEKYVDIAEQAIQTFLYPVLNQGVTDYIDNNSPVFQEYPAMPAPHVLNGFIFALLGVKDFALYSNESQWNDLANKGANTILEHWQKWDMGFWTRYDLFTIKRPASHMYHELHVRQMLALGRVFQNNRFLEIAERWKKMQDKPFNHVLWLGYKIYEKTYLTLGRKY